MAQKKNALSAADKLRALLAKPEIFIPSSALINVLWAMI